MFVQDPNVCLPDQMKASLSITTTYNTICTSINTTANTTFYYYYYHNFFY